MLKWVEILAVLVGFGVPMMWVIGRGEKRHYIEPDWHDDDYRTMV